jgi:hypothetical protein
MLKRLLRWLQALAVRVLFVREGTLHHHRARSLHLRPMFIGATVLAVAGPFLVHGAWSDLLRQLVR